MKVVSKPCLVSSTKSRRKSPRRRPRSTRVFRRPRLFVVYPSWNMFIICPITLTMSQAVVRHSFGGTDSLSLIETEIPVPGSEEVRVRITVADLNPSGWQAAQSPELAALFGLTLPTGFGNDFAGIVDGVGSRHCADRWCGRRSRQSCDPTCGTRRCPRSWWKPVNSDHPPSRPSHLPSFVKQSTFNGPDMSKEK
jgi:hypothetical protein